MNLRECIGFPGYFVTDDGRVFSSFRTGNADLRELRQETTRLGYKRANIGGRGKRAYIHRLVLEAFVGHPPSPSHQCMHLNGIRDDNRVENLAWGTASENQIGTLSDNLNVKLTKADVVEIRELLQQGISVGKIAQDFGVSSGNISAIKSRRSWNHI